MSGKLSWLRPGVRMSCSRRWCPQTTSRSRCGDGYGRPSGGGIDPGVWRVGLGVLRLAEETAAEAGDSSRLADGPALDDPCRFEGNLRGPVGECGVHDRERYPGRLRSGRDVAPKCRHPVDSRQPEPAPQGPFDTDGVRSRRSELRPQRPGSTMGHRHHLTPHP